MSKKTKSVVTKNVTRASPEEELEVREDKLAAFTAARLQRKAQRLEELHKQHPSLYKKPVTNDVHLRVAPTVKKLMKKQQSRGSSEGVNPAHTKPSKNTNNSAKRRPISPAKGKDKDTASLQSSTWSTQRQEEVHEVQDVLDQLLQSNEVSRTTHRRLSVQRLTMASMQRRLSVVAAAAHTDPSSDVVDIVKKYINEVESCWDSDMKKLLAGNPGPRIDDGTDTSTNESPKRGLSPQKSPKYSNSSSIAVFNDDTDTVPMNQKTSQTDEKDSSARTSAPLWISDDMSGVPASPTYYDQSIKSPSLDQQKGLPVKSEMKMQNQNSSRRSSGSFWGGFFAEDTSGSEPDKDVNATVDVHDGREGSALGSLASDGASASVVLDISDNDNDDDDDDDDDDDGGGDDDDDDDDDDGGGGDDENVDDENVDENVDNNNSDDDEEEEWGVSASEDETDPNVQSDLLAKCLDWYFKQNVVCIQVPSFAIYRPVQPSSNLGDDTDLKGYVNFEVKLDCSGGDNANASYQTDKGFKMMLLKRFSEFENFDEDLRSAFTEENVKNIGTTSHTKARLINQSYADAISMSTSSYGLTCDVDTHGFTYSTGGRLQLAIPSLPPKRLISSFGRWRDRNFLEDRRKMLESWLVAILPLQSFRGAPAPKNSSSRSRPFSLDTANNDNAIRRAFRKFLVREWQ